MKNEAAIIWEGDALQILQLIGLMRSELTKYAALPDAKPNIIKLRQENINRIYMFYVQSKEAIETLDALASSEFARGFSQGQKSIQKQASERPHPLDKEHVRYHHKTMVMKKWEDHL